MKMAGIEISAEDYEQWKQEKAWIERLEKANSTYIIADSNHQRIKKELAKATQEKELAAKNVSQIIAERSKPADPQMRLPFGDKDPMSGAGGEDAAKSIDVIGYTQAVRDKLCNLGLLVVGDIEDLILGKNPKYPKGPDDLKLPKQESRQVVSQYQRFKGVAVDESADTTSEAKTDGKADGAAPVVTGNNAMPKGKKRRSKITKAKVVRVIDGCPTEFKVGDIVEGEVKDLGFLVKDPVWLFREGDWELYEDPADAVADEAPAEAAPAAEEAETAPVETAAPVEAAAPPPAETATAETAPTVA